MKRAFFYELKRNVMPLAIFAAFAVACSVVYAFTATLSYGSGTLEDSCDGMFTVLLCILCTVVPVMQFSYRMEQRSTDLWYSMPISRKNLMLVRVLGGLVLALVPYTLAYWLGVACVAMQESGFVFAHYLSLWAVSLPLGAGLFGVNAFLFTRANTVRDGILFLVLWACLLPLIVATFFSGLRFKLDWDPDLPDYLNHRTGLDVASFFFPYSPAAYLSGIFDVLLRGSAVSAFSRFSLWFVLPVAVIEGVGAYVGLFLLSDRDKSENAGQISSSWLGYRTLIPAYIVLLFGVAETLLDNSVIVYVIVALIGAALYFAYRRSFRLKKSDVICYAASVVLGIALALIFHYVG